MSTGEFHFTLTEKRDKNGDLYLFGGLKMLNAVLFIRPEPEEPGRPRKWKAVLKPYSPREDAHQSVWDDEATSEQGDTNEREEDRTQTGRRPRR